MLKMISLALLLKTFPQEKAQKILSGLNEDEAKKIEVKIINILEMLVKADLAVSKGEARRLVEQGGVKVDGAVVKDINQIIEIRENGTLLQKGKRGFVRVIKR